MKNKIIMLLGLVLKIISLLKISNLINKDILIVVTLILLVILFAFSFVKQNKYISLRVKKINTRGR